VPRPRKPTAVLEASGAFIKNPQRKRPLEPKPTGELGDPPSHLEREEVLTWHEMAADIPPGVATNADRRMFEVLVCLMVGFRHRRLSGTELGQLTSLSGRFGMTPADRSKVKVSNDNAQDPLEDFLGGKPSREVTQ
jgi:phage terminase small subunit